MPLKNVVCIATSSQCGFLLCFYFHVRCLTRLLFMSLINLFMDFGSKRVKYVKIETFHRFKPPHASRRGSSNFMSECLGRLLSVSQNSAKIPQTTGCSRAMVRVSGQTTGHKTRYKTYGRPVCTEDSKKSGPAGPVVCLGQQELRLATGLPLSARA